MLLEVFSLFIYLVRTGGGFILLDKFIEVNAPIEEAKLMKASNVTDKFKTNSGMVKLTSGGKPVYELEAVGKNLGITISTTPQKGTGNAKSKLSNQLKK